SRSRSRRFSTEKRSPAEHTFAHREYDGGGMTTERLLNETVSVPEAICRVLEQAGIDTVFGMPGGRTLAIYDALHDHRDTIRTVPVWLGRARQLGREAGVPGLHERDDGAARRRPGGAGHATRSEARAHRTAGAGRAALRDEGAALDGRPRQRPDPVPDASLPA